MTASQACGGPRGADNTTSCGKGMRRATAHGNPWLTNLVGCAAQIRAYEQFQEDEDRKAKEDIVNKRQAKNVKLAADAAARKAAAAAALAEGGSEEEDEDALEGGDRVTASGVLDVHKGKRKRVWGCFDLTKENPSCKLLKDGSADTLCGHSPSLSAGTTNFWHHLWTYHKKVWYELKQADGQLNKVGEEEAAALR